MFVLCPETTCCYNKQSDAVKLSRKELDKNNIEELLAKYRKNIFDEGRLFSTKPGFRVVDKNKMCRYKLKKWDSGIFIRNVKCVKMAFTLLLYIYNSFLFLFCKLIVYFRYNFFNLLFTPQFVF